MWRAVQNLKLWAHGPTIWMLIRKPKPMGPPTRNLLYIILSFLLLFYQAWPQIMKLLASLKAPPLHGGTPAGKEASRGGRGSQSSAWEAVPRRRSSGEVRRWWGWCGESSCGGWSFGTSSLWRSWNSTIVLWWRTS